MKVHFFRIFHMTEQNNTLGGPQNKIIIENHAQK